MNVEVAAETGERRLPTRGTKNPPVSIDFRLIDRETSHQTPMLRVFGFKC
jgi:hypothetical protein